MRLAIEILDDVLMELDSCMTDEKWYGYFEGVDEDDLQIKWEGLADLHREIRNYMKTVKDTA